jgi:hypothetical protein
VLGAYLLLFPKAQVQVIIPIGFFMMRKLQAGWLLGLWIAFQVISGLSADISGGGVAWWAHVGGFVAGMVLLPLFREKDIVKALDPGLPSARVPKKSVGRTRIPDSRNPSPQSEAQSPPQNPPQSPPKPQPRRPRPAEPPPLPERPTVQRRRDPPNGIR